MQPGERVTLITKIAGALGERKWTEVDLILEQFGMTTSAWEGDLFSYVVFHTKAASDEALITLHEFLFPGEAPSPPSEGPADETAGGVWAPGLFRLFMSHSSKQALEVGELKQELLAYGIDAFVAHADIEPTKEWQDEIEVALRTCDALATYLTPDFLASRWADQEVGYALARAVLIIPIRKGETPYGFMGKYQALSGANKNPPRIARDLAEILAGHPLTSSRYASARTVYEVNRFVDTPSYNDARSNLQRLLALPPEGWTPDLLERVEQACSDNHELSAQWAFGNTSVADEARTLVEKIRKKQTR